MKSNLVDGFALPFAVALIAIFTIIFGSILTTTNFYNQQKLNALKKIELDKYATIGLGWYLKKGQCPFPTSSLPPSAEKQVCNQIKAGFYSSNFFEDPINSVNSDISIFYHCSTETEPEPKIIFYSCVTSKDLKLVVGRTASLQN